MNATERPVQAGEPAVRKEAWFVRSIEASELPAVCAYCRPRARREQAVAVVGFRIVDVYPSGAEIVKGERKAPVCVDHGVYVQQKYVMTH